MKKKPYQEPDLEPGDNTKYINHSMTIMITARQSTIRKMYLISAYMNQQRKHIPHTLRRRHTTTVHTSVI